MSTQLDAASIARLSLHDPAHFSIQHSQTLHRLALLRHWNISTGSKVLGLGCGQGDCTTVLAHAVGDQGMVVAVDPAGLNYGASFCFYPPADPSRRTMSSRLILLQVRRTPSVKHKITSRKARWVNELLGFNDPLWTIFPPSPPTSPPHPLPTSKSLTQQCWLTAYGTSHRPRSSSPLSAPSSSTASVFSSPSGL